MASMIVLHEHDNVGICKVSLPAGILLVEKGVTLIDSIPSLHKVAIRPIANGQAIIKYGQVIGYANRDIGAGEHVHTHNCVLGPIERNFSFCQSATPTSFVHPDQQIHFQGYQRASGKVGTRNYLGILTTVNCSARVANAIAQHFSLSHELDDFPNIDGVVALTHEGGCGMGAEGEGYYTLRRTLQGYARHPNFGGVMMVGLGCETMQIQQVVKDSGLADGDNLINYGIQEVGGTRAAIKKGIEAVRELLPEVNRCQRQAAPVSELIIGLQCGGSDALSGVTANPALGIAGDILVRHGGTIVLSETPEIYGAEHLLTARAESPLIAEKLLQRVSWWLDYAARNQMSLNNNPSPGNKEGGLTTIVEKSLGAQAKSGSTNLREVFLYGEEITTKGFVFMDSPGYDPVSATGQVAAGAQILCFTTGRGSAFGCKPAPCIKLATNSAIYSHMHDDMDLNCGRVLDGEISLEQSGQEIFAEMIAVASGKATKSELLGYGDNEFVPWRIGAVM